MTTPTISDSALLQALNWRYATKVFDPARKIPPATWSTLEQCLVLSPSSFGLQPYRFLVIQDSKTRAKLLPHAWNQRQVIDASHFVVLAARTNVTEAEIDTLLELVADTRQVSKDSLSGYRGMMTGMLISDRFKPLLPHWTARQVYLALGNLLTSAALLGVDACPMEGFVPAEFDKILGLSGEGFSAVVCCALGYRSAQDKYAALAKVRFAKEDLLASI